MTQPKQSNELRAAMQELRKGNNDAARKLVSDAAASAAQKHGEQSAEAANAQHELGLVLATLEDWEGAAGALRKAVAIPREVDLAAGSPRLTYLLSLGGVLEQLGNLEEAEKVLKACRDERVAAFGTEHPAYATALEQLAGFYLRKGEYELAQDAIDHAAQTYGAIGNPGIVGALVLRAEIMRAQGSKDDPFEGLEGLPNDLIEQIAVAALERAKVADPLIALEMLGDVHRYVEARLGASHLATLHVLNTLASLARGVGDAERREKALAALINGFDSRGDAAQGLEAMLGLAIAQTEALKPDEAIDTLKRAASRAHAGNDHATHSRVLRNLGVLLRDTGRNDEALATFQKAVEAGERAKDRDNTGRAEAALGIFLQHSGKLDEARTQLESAKLKLPEGDADARVVKRHLEALASKSDCGCAKLSGSIGEAISRMVLESAPKGLLAGLEISFKDGQPDVQMRMAREPTAAELEQLESAIQSSIRKLGAVPPRPNAD